MIVAEEFYSLDMHDAAGRPVLPRHWKPTTDDIYCLLQFDVRDSKADAGSMFSVMVATPSALVQHAENSILSGRGVIVIQTYYFDEIENYIQEVSESCFVPGNDEKTAAKLMRHFFWEYEDMNGS